MHRCQQIEARGAGVAGFDAVDAFHPTEQMIVVADRLAGKFEGLGREIAEIARKSLLDRAPEKGQIAGRGYLPVVGQARSVDVCRVRHAERMGLARHHLREVFFIAADRLRHRDGDVVGRPGHDGLDRILDAQRFARLQPELGRRLARGVRGHRNRQFERQAAFFKLLEQQIERHHLGERGRMARLVVARGVEGAAGVFVDDDRGEGRIAGGGGRSARGGGPIDGAIGLVDLLAPVMRLGLRGEHRKGGAENTNPGQKGHESRPGFRKTQRHELPLEPIQRTAPG